MGWKYDGADITLAKHNGVAITQGKYNGTEFYQSVGFDLANFRITGTTHVKMKLEAGQVARSNGQVMLWNDGTDEAASGSILDGSQTITGISGVTQNLIRVAKWMTPTSASSSIAASPRGTSTTTY